LEQAGENRIELQKVLEHYKQEPLKLKAAEFLISYMGYNKFSFEGEIIARYDTLFAIYDSLWIGRVKDFEVYQDKYFILDKSTTSSVFIFDNNGKNILYFNKYGGGPGEYLDPFDISIDRGKKQIMLWCDKKRSVFTYDFEGNFTETDRLNIYANAVHVLSTGNYAAYANYRQNSKLVHKSEYPNLLIIDKKGTGLASSNFFPYFKKKKFWSTDRDFSNLNNDTISIIPDHTNVIYYIADDKIYPRFNIDFGNRNLDEEYWTKIVEMNPEMEYIMQLSQDYCLIRKYLETPAYIFITYFYKNKNANALYSKKTGQLIQFEEISGCIWPLFNPEDFVDDKFYLLLEPHLLKQTSLEVVDVDFGKVKKLLEDIDEIDNPVVMEMTLKGF
jgi:hypothetical protein